MNMDGQDFLPPTRPDSNEARLWQAVIIQVIKDQDWQWFFPTTEDDANDYLEICELAGVDAEGLRQKIAEHALKQAAARSHAKRRAGAA